jgi:hypothetical protein
VPAGRRTRFNTTGTALAGTFASATRVCRRALVTRCRQKPPETEIVMQQRPRRFGRSGGRSRTPPPGDGSPSPASAALRVVSCTVSCTITFPAGARSQAMAEMARFTSLRHGALRSAGQMPAPASPGPESRLGAWASPIDKKLSMWARRNPAPYRLAVSGSGRRASSTADYRVPASGLLASANTVSGSGGLRRHLVPAGPKGGAAG